MLSDAAIQLAKLIVKANERGVRIVYKEGLWWRLLGALCYVFTFGKNKTFMYSITTVGKTIGVPPQWSLWPAQTKLEILTHELVHVDQASRMSLPVFWFLYFLFPLPLGLAWFRYSLEREAYLADYSVAIAAGADRRVLIDEVVETLCGSDYGWAWPFRKSVRAWFDKRLPPNTI